MGPVLRAIAASFLITLTALDAPAQTSRPQGAGRIVRLFDFEERPLNPEPVPMHWVRAQDDQPARVRPGFPPWNKAAFDTAHAVSGAHSVMLPTQGGSTSLRLSSGVAAAIPGADYVVGAVVRTERLQRAGARIAARFLDAQHRPIPSSERLSEVVTTDGRWAPLAVELDGDTPGAAWIQIELLLVQPVHAAGSRRIADSLASSLAKHRVWLEDVQGGAWFDDVVIYQLPRIDLSLDDAVCIVTEPGAPTLNVSIRDLAGEALEATLAVYDLDGHLEDERRFDVPPGGASLRWTPTLDTLGWRRAILEILSDGRPIVRRSLDFAWLPSPASGEASEAGRFVLLVERDPMRELDTLPPVARALGVGVVQLNVWTRDLVEQSIPLLVDKLARPVERITADGRRVGFTLAEIPADLAETLAIDNLEHPLAALARPSADETNPDWAPHLAPLLSAFGQRVQRWQIGATDDDRAYWRPDLAADLARARAALRRLVPRPVLTIPWGAWQTPDDRALEAGELALTLTARAPLASVAPLIESWERASDATVRLETLDHNVHGARAAAGDLVKRAALAWSADATRLAIESPWVWRGEGRRARLTPTPALPVFRQLAERLGGRRVVGELPIAPGARCLILDGPQGGALICWNDWAQDEDAVIEARLADGPVEIFDVFGNPSTLYPDSGAHRLQLEETPVFVEGVNVPLLLFRAAFRIEPDFLPAQATLHAAELELTNPWPVAIAGRLRVVEPQDWRIEPRVAPFEIPAGATRRIPVDIAFGVGEEAGARRIIADAVIDADQRYDNVHLATSVEVGLTTTQLTPSYAVIPNARGERVDLAVTLSIRNNGDEPITLQAFALAPGFAREQAPVSNLAAGQTAIRRFVFRGGAERLRGQRIRVGLIEVSGAGRLNKSLVIE